MGSRKLRSLNILSDVAAARFEEAGFSKCEDILFESPETVAKLLGTNIAAAELFFDTLFAKVAPTPTPLLSLSQCPPLATSLPSLDRSMGGGVPGSCLLEVMGPPGVGKSQFAMMLTAMCSREGRTVLYIDTERKFSGERVEAMGGDLRYVQLREAPTLDSLLAIFSEFDLQVAETGAKLLVIDSVAAVVRCEGLSTIVRSQLLSRLATDLKEMAHRYSLTVVLTNQVTGNFQAALGNTWHHAVSIRVALSSPEGVGSTQPRTLTVVKSHFSPTISLPYAISHAGVKECGV